MTSHEACGARVVDKPSGPTSFAMCAALRQLYQTRRGGQCGTLDPMASGVLVVLIGEATKLSSVLTSDDKHYQAEVVFGSETDTLDALGTVVTEQTLSPGWVQSAAIERCLDEERLRKLQIPPQFSAIKTAGTAAYHKARRGEYVELEPRPVTVSQLRCTYFDDQRMRLELHASKGYYVRSLCRDLCRALGVPGHLGALRRTRSGAFDLAQVVSWPLLEAASLLDPGACVRHAMPCAELTEEGTLRARQGKRLGVEHFVGQVPDDVAAWLAPNGAMVALGSKDADDASYRVRRGFTP
jgi:tRNA pseudouridine55 synthase